MCGCERRPFPRRVAHAQAARTVQRKRAWHTIARSAGARGMRARSAPLQEHVAPSLLCKRLARACTLSLQARLRARARRLIARASYCERSRALAAAPAPCSASVPTLRARL
eukprot:5774794-Pleurochrysis_carterae.AAC.1